LQNTSLKIVALKDILIAMWRLNIISPPDQCNKQDECLFLCPASADRSEFWNQVYFDNPVAQDLDKGSSATLNASGRIQVVKAICVTTWRFGEQAEAASARDPSFWPIHPTLERLYQYKLLLEPSLLSNNEWKAILDNKTLCSYNTLGSDCFGHHPDDRTAFFVTTYDSAFGGFRKSDLTVRQVLEASNPWNYHLDYIYDDFAWAHCDEHLFEEAPDINQSFGKSTSYIISPTSNQSTCNADGVHFSDDMHCTNRDSPVLGGVDVVAYHSLHWDRTSETRDQPIQGKPEFSVILEGSFIFWFANKQNRDRFAARVKYYQPQIGGFSTLALSGGTPDNFHPLDFEPRSLPRIDSSAWYLNSGGELFLFQNQNDLDTFLDLFTSDAEYGLTQAKENWKNWVTTATCYSKDFFNMVCISS